MATQEALVVTEIGKPLSKISRSIPVPGPNEILIKVAAAGINPVDQKNRDYGALIAKRLPAIVGTDIVGTIERLGENVTNFSIGDRIMSPALAADSLDHGVLQQYSLVYADAGTTKIPDSISFDEAATLPSNVTTAFIALFHSTGLSLPLPTPLSAPNSTFDYINSKLLVVGAGSNCGKFAVQFARMAGIRTIIALAGINNKAELENLGATHVVDRFLSETDLQSQVTSIVGGDDLIYVLDAVHFDHTFAATFLSKTKKSLLVHLLPGEVDETIKAEKKGGMEHKMIYGSVHMHPDIGIPLWKAVPGWLESGVLKPLGYTVVEGLDADKVNSLMDLYKEGKGSKTHVHP